MVSWFLNQNFARVFVGTLLCLLAAGSRYSPASDAENAAAPPLYTYVLSETIPSEVHLGPLARTAHYAWESGFIVLKSAIAYHLAGHLSAIVFPLMEGLPKAPAMIRMQSEAHLQALDRMKQNKNLLDLNHIPGIQRIALVKTGEFEMDFTHILATQLDSKSLVVIQTNQRLPTTPYASGPNYWEKEWGNPIEVQDTANTKLRIRMQTDVIGGSSYWDIPIAEIFAKHSLPASTAQDWRKDFEISQALENGGENTNKAVKLVKEHLKGRNYQGLKLEAAIVSSDGSERVLGNLAQGEKAWKMIGNGITSKAIRRFMGRERTLPLRTQDGPPKSLRTCVIDHFSRAMKNYKIPGFTADN